ncbi:BON domain-containing protein [Marinobacterium mangrovicola]|uniref:Osmotically-inducible protein OsmY n=1 Tax=Marinobacterium mangrovicola TaxID=1476959 RepID=A0A4R1GQ82_9GAMM|nr:BON domain-containing protein [Marinobacterium mangrovicola]TCK09540.1 osmotically-inducible protein OsmY [Marinobacterium mangrovicola]
MKIKKTTLALATASILAAPVAMADMNDWEGQSKDAWLDGKLETALMLNTELNNFKIDTDVDKTVVTLSGQVSNETEKELAGQIAANIDGITDVNNELTVESETGASDEPNVAEQFASDVNDLTIQAGLKMRYATSDGLDGSDIDIESEAGVVTLTGQVPSNAAHDLALEIAQGYDRVRDVEDDLKVVN